MLRVFIIFIYIFSCKPIQRNSDTKHTVSSLRVDLPDYFWQEYSPQQFTFKDDNSPENDRNQFLTNSEIGLYLTERAQWIHQKAVKSNPKLSSLPKPIVIVNTLSQGRVAMSHDMLMCIPIKIIVGNKEEMTDEKSTLVMKEDSGSIYFDKLPKNKECRDIELKNNQIKEYLSLLKLDYTNCFKKIDGTYHYDESCDLFNLDTLPGYYNSFAIYTKTNVISIDADYLKHFTEEEALGILTHELGHYYKHSAIGLRKDVQYNYFYNRDRISNPGTKPKYNEALQKHAKDYLKEYIPPLDYHVDFDLKGTQPGVLYYIFADNSKLAKYGTFDFNLENIDEIKQACQEIVDYDQEIGYASYFPYHYNWTPGEQEYFRILKKAEVCLKGKPLSGPPLNMQYLEEILNLINFETPNTSEIIKSSKNIWEVLVKINSDENIPQIIEDTNKHSEKLTKNLNRELLGKYTPEQEADEIALELSSNIGISLNTFFNFFFKILEINDGKWTGNSEKRKLCEEEMTKGFTDFIPIETFDFAYYTSCQRVYNLYRESKAHEKHYLSIMPSEPYKGNPQLWKKLINEL